MESAQHCCEDRAWNISTGEHAGIAEGSLSNTYLTQEVQDCFATEVNNETSHMGSHWGNRPRNRPAGLGTRSSNNGTAALAVPTKTVWGPDHGKRARPVDH